MELRGSTGTCTGSYGEYSRRVGYNAEWSCNARSGAGGEFYGGTSSGYVTGGRLWLHW